MNRVVFLAVTLAVQLALVGAATYGQLSARVLGEDHLFLVQPVDPRDPFRGAYVDLDYPGLGEPDESGDGGLDDGERGDVFVTLVRDGDYWAAGEFTRTRPDDGAYLACDDSEWRVRCGIESWFASDAEARALEEELARGGAVATVRIDDRGNAALVDVSAR